MPTLIQRSFASGELAPALGARADLAKFATGLRLCSDFLIRAQGGAHSRPGTRFVAELDDSSKKGRLIPFSFNTEQTYMLVFEDQLLRVVKDGSMVLAGGGPAIFELATPYVEADLPRLIFTQSADVLTITHPSYDPRNLSRLADDNWSLDVIDYSPVVASPERISGAFSASIISSITKADPAVVTTATDHGFSTDYVVRLGEILTTWVGMTELKDRAFVIDVLSPTTFELRGENSLPYTPYVSGGLASFDNTQVVGGNFGTFSKRHAYVITAVNDVGDESLPSEIKGQNSQSLSETGGLLIGWLEVVAAAYYRVYKESSDNSGTFGWIGDSANLGFVDYNIAPLLSDSPPIDSQPFTGVDNKPASVTYYQQRQVFGNTNDEPQTVFTSQSGIFNSLRTSSPARDSDAITFALAARKVNEIRHLLPLDALVMLTSGAEYVVGGGQDRVLTPSTINSRPQSFNGSSWVRPEIINSTAIYIQEKGTRVRDLSYEFSSDKYTGNDLSVMAEHLFEGFEISEMAYADEPYGILWLVRSDGVMLGLTYLREHQMWAWHQHHTQGLFESVASVTEGDRDAVYFIVNRTIGGQTKRYIERFEPRVVEPIEDAFFVDSGLTYSGAPATVFSGADHLEGESVAVLADGNEVTGVVVENGQFTLQTAASKVHFGLSYTPTIETLDADTAAIGESIKQSDVSISKFWIVVEKSRGGFAGPLKDDGTVGEMFEFKPRFQSDGYGTIQPKTFTDEVTLTDQWAKSGGVRIEQRSPLPLSILAVIPELDIGDTAD